MLIKVKVFPQANKERVLEKSKTSFEVQTKARPLKGEANESVARLLAGYFHIQPGLVRLVKGAKSRNKIFELSGLNDINQVAKAVEILKNGGIIAYPTDTVYGIGCNIFDKKGVNLLFRLKGREFNKPLSVAVSDFEMLEELVFLTEKNRKIIKKLLPGPFTFILPKKKRVPDLITIKSKFVGIRIPENKIALEIIKKAGFPIVTTSANFSGKKAPITSNEINLEVDFIVKGECKRKKPSTVIDLNNRKIIRKGAGFKRIKKLLFF